MSKHDTKDLKKCLKPFPLEKQKIAFRLRSFVWDLYPKANELIYDNYNAVAFGWSTSDRVSHVFCTIAVGRSSGNIHFGFYWGSRLTDTKKMLLGEGNQYRYILVHSMEDFPAAYMRSLMKQAHRYSLSRMKSSDIVLEGATILKSVSAVKRKKPQAPRKTALISAKKRA